MSQLIRPSALALLATAALTAGATAQVPNSNYTIVPLLGVTGGATAIFANGAANSQLDGNVEIVGFVPTSGQQIWSSDVSFPQGGNDYRLTLALQAQSGTLLPQGHPVNGAPSDRFGIALGDAISGFPIEVGGNEALFVGAITFFALDSAQNYVFGPMDVTSAANLHDPDFGGGWDGSIGFTVPQSMLLGPVHSVQLVIDYRVGQPN
ncbi:MAG: hypothetical protein KAI24_05735, partial [Planctomycetes bacterium]|nr:hypothetical protein [Planctomycetota bacterium]